MAAAIIVKGLKKAYKKQIVLKDVSFSVEAGTIFALLGSNGAGKTTTINILTTLIAMDGGSASVNGNDVATKADAVRKSISLTGQFAAVDEVLTGRENLELIGNLRHVSNPAQMARELLENFKLTDAADRAASTYSGGMRRRLDIAMSLIGQPSIIFLDEPTTGLDPEARNDMWQTIRKLAAGGTTIFLTTQYLEEADELADKIALLHQGKIVANGTASKLKQRVPKGVVELTFHDDEQLQHAKNVLQKHYKVSSTVGGSVISVSTGGSASELADLFIRLRDAHIEPSDFSQKVPTLDDVFFKLTSTKRGEK